ncbi:hypothetical protein AB837_00053 [bacterium AB1]|nr:hypothetical protein AB837_00053 [bacterium AB1]
MKQYHIVNGYNESNIILYCMNFTFNIENNKIYINESIYLKFRKNLNMFDIIFNKGYVKYILIYNNKIFFKCNQNTKTNLLKTLICIMVENLNINNASICEICNYNEIIYELNYILYAHNKSHVQNIQQLIHNSLGSVLNAHGGDVILYDICFKENILYLLIVGSCSSCISSINLLKTYIINLIKNDIKYEKYNIIFSD